LKSTFASFAQASSRTYEGSLNTYEMVRMVPLCKFENLAILLLIMGAAGSCARTDSLRAKTDSKITMSELAKIDTTKTASVPDKDDVAEKAVKSETKQSLKNRQRKTLSTLLAELLINNPDIAIAGAREKEQWFGVKVAEAAKYPTLDVSASGGPQRVFIPSPGGDAIRRDVAANFKQTLFDFGATKNDIKRAERSYASATKARIAKAESVADNVMEAFLDVKKSDELIAVTRKNIDAHQKILQLVSLTADNGSGTVADVKRITTRLESAKSDLIDLTTTRSDGADAFKNLTDSDYDMIDAKGYERLFGKITGLDAAAIEVNPQVQSINDEIEALTYQIESVKAGKLPVIGLQGSVKAAKNVNSPEDTDEQVSSFAIATLKIPLYDGGLNKNQVGQIQSRLEGAKLRLEKQKRDLLQQAENVKRLSDSGNNKSGSIQARVDAAKKVAELAFEQFKSGGRTLFELLDAQSESFKSQSDLIQQVYERKKSMLKALQIKGQLVDSILAIAPPQPGTLTASSVTTKSITTVAPPSGDFNLPGVKVR
jgi:adhesin transport system outer membrane protein